MIISKGSVSENTACECQVDFIMTLLSTGVIYSMFVLCVHWLDSSYYVTAGFPGPLFTQQTTEDSGTQNMLNLLSRTIVNNQPSTQLVP